MAGLDSVGTPTGGLTPTTGTTTAANIILSIRDQIPDPVNDASQNGNAVSLASILRWLNDAGRILAITAGVIQDWDAVPSASGMDIYVLPSYINTVNQVWYDTLPLSRTAELDDLFTTKITGRSWWFGSHSVHAVPRLHVWPSCDRTASTTTLAADITADASTFTVASAAGIKPYGFLRIENEQVLYRNIVTATGVVTNILRGQAGTTAVAHTAGAGVQECNIFFKCTRLPVPLTGANDLIEIPQGLWPLLELYVLGKVREMEQDGQNSARLLRTFKEETEKLGHKAQLQVAKQGLQVRTYPPGPQLYGGRTFIP